MFGEFFIPYFSLTSLHTSVISGLNTSSGLSAIAFANIEILLHRLKTLRVNRFLSSQLLCRMPELNIFSVIVKWGYELYCVYSTGRGVLCQLFQLNLSDISFFILSKVSFLTGSGTCSGSRFFSIFSLIGSM